MNVSVLVGLKNNLEYSKNFYTTFREIYPNVEICFVSYGSTDGTDGWLRGLIHNDPNIRIYIKNKNVTFSDTYNKAAEIATKNYIVFLHNDIIVAPNFLENILKHLDNDEKRAIGYTTIEPPIFAGHPRPGKIIQDFGIDLESFNTKINKLSFYSTVSNLQEENKDKTEPGTFFFMGLPKSLFLKMGGFHNIFTPMFKEDDDFIRRMGLLGIKMFTSLDAICYHFVSKTSRFSDEYKHISKQIEKNSIRNYTRKWNSEKSGNKFNVEFFIENYNIYTLSMLEPWCDRIYVDWDNEVEVYIENEQLHTTFNMSDRVKSNKITPKGDIIVKFDASKITNNDLRILETLQDTLGQIKTTGKYEFGAFVIIVNSLVNNVENLIFI